MANYFTVGTALRLKGNGSFATSLQSSASLTSGTVFTLPPAYPLSTGVLESDSAGVLTATPNPTLGAPLIKTALYIEDPGVGTFKNVFQSGTLATDLTYTLPTAFPASSPGVLESSAGGTLTWNENVARTNAPVNKLKTYSGGYYALAGDDDPLVKPSVGVEFAQTGDNTFVAEITLLCVDHVSDENVATLKFTATGGKLSGLSTTPISVGNIQNTGAAGAHWSSAVSTTPVKIVMEKSAGLAGGNYSVLLHVSILNGSVLRFINEGTAAVLTEFTY